MEKTYNVVELITDSSDQQYPKKVISAQILLSVRSENSSLSGILNMEIAFDNNIIFTPFESLTEELVNSWLDVNLINQNLDSLEASLINSSQQIMERYMPPWVSVPTREDMLSGVNDIQQDLNQQATTWPPLPSFEETVTEIVMKILKEKSLVNDV